jgi:2-keto-4-pentenoate hydratase/2-oxohepta-3-ene-1,7-dioic acid hydratase in catechol pathway
MTFYIIQKSDLQVRIGKIICLARTYAKHAQEMKSEVPQQPLLFLKPESAIIHTNESIIIPRHSQCLHHEIELGIVIGKNGKNISHEHAMDYVLGYVVALDITARDIQTQAKKKGWPWSIAKGFDTFAPISSVVLKEQVVNPHDLSLELRINGRVKQRSSTKFMVFSIPQIIEFISDIMTVKTGDLILTGTPEGVGEIKKGDVIKATLGSVCSLTVDVRQGT